MSKFTDLVKQLVEGGANPNDLQNELELAVQATELWVLWGNGKWMPYLVCSICGSVYGGVCCEIGTTGPIVSSDPKFHKNQPGRQMIPYKEWNEKASQIRWDNES